jgi:tRNA-2-methylthio-N6-dimethylallyladenosine synthase
MKKERLAVLQARIILQAQKISEAMVNTEQMILVVGGSKKEHMQQMSGRTENNRVVNFHGTPDLVGKMVRVRVTEALRNSLRGELVG